MEAFNCSSVSNGLAVWQNIEDKLGDSSLILPTLRSQINLKKTDEQCQRFACAGWSQEGCCLYSIKQSGAFCSFFVKDTLKPN